MKSIGTIIRQIKQKGHCRLGNGFWLVGEYPEGCHDQFVMDTRYANLWLVNDDKQPGWAEYMGTVRLRPKEVKFINDIEELKINYKEWNKNSFVYPVVRQERRL